MACFDRERKLVIGVETGKASVIEKAVNFVEPGIAGEEVPGLALEAVSLKFCEPFLVNAKRGLALVEDW